VTGYVVPSLQGGVALLGGLQRPLGFPCSRFEFLVVNVSADRVLELCLDLWVVLEPAFKRCVSFSLEDRVGVPIIPGGS